MRHVLDDPAGLSPRAVRFLGLMARRVPVHTPDVLTTDEIQLMRSRLPGVDLDAAFALFQHAAARYAGLQYPSIAWSFEETVTFLCVPWGPDDYSQGDGDAMAELIGHDVAQPYSVWLRGDGAVMYCFTGATPEVPVFSTVDALIETEALYRECADWVPISIDDTPSLAAVEAHAAQLTLIPEACGYTEHWWEQDGFRLHVWKTFAAAFPGAGARWAVWARDSSGEAAARSFLAQARAIQM